MATAFMNLPFDLRRTEDALEELRAALEALPRGRIPTDVRQRAELAAVARAAESEMLSALQEAETLIRQLER